MYLILFPLNIIVIFLLNFHIFGQSINFGVEFKSQLNFSVNFWLHAEFGEAVSLDQCTVLIVDNNLQYDLTEQLESQVALRLYLTDHPNLSLGFQFNYLQHFSLPCTIAYYNLPTINWLGLLVPRFIYKLPGSVFSSFHVIIIQGAMLGLGNVADEVMRRLETKLKTSPLVQQYIGSEVQNDNEIRNLKLMHHLVIAKYITLPAKGNSTDNSNSSVDTLTLNLSTFNTWFNRSIDLENFTFSPLSLNSTATFSGSTKGHTRDIYIEFNKAMPTLLFPDKWHNLNGGYLKVATTPETSQRQLEQFIRTQTVQSGGYTAAGMYYILQYLNATPIFTISSANFGQKDPFTNKWIGNVGEMLNGNVFMASGMGLVHDKLEVITYSQPYHYDKVTFITTLPKETPTPSGSFDFLSRPFHVYVWYSVVGSLIAILTAIFVKKFCIEKIQYCERISASKSASIIFHLLVRPMFDQANHDDLRRRNLLADNLSRILMSIWLLSLIVLITTYKSNSISILLAPTILYPPKTFLELIDSNYRIGSVLYNESFFGGAFNKLDNRVGMEIRSRVKGYSVFKPDCYLEVGKPGNEDICMSISAFLELAANKFLTDANGMKLYKMAEDSLFPIPAACAVPKDFPHLVENINKIIYRYFETGLTVQTFKMESQYNAKLGQRFSKNVLKAKSLKEKESDWLNGIWFTNKQSLKQGLNHFVTILLFGYGIALVLFCCEIFVFYSKAFMKRAKICIIDVK